MKITQAMKLACARYFMHRAGRGDKPWDKQADLKAIDAAAGKSGWAFCAAAGTFWFQKGKTILVCNETNYLDGGIKEKISGSK